MENKYAQVARAPRTFDELAAVVDAYRAAGFDGCAGSVDGTHVAWLGFRAGDRAEFTGKEGYPTLVFGVTVDHTYKIMHITRAHPGATNDNVVMLDDDFHQKLMHSELYSNFEFRMVPETRLHRRDTPGSSPSEHAKVTPKYTAQSLLKALGR